MGLLIHGTTTAALRAFIAVDIKCAAGKKTVRGNNCELVYYFSMIFTENFLVNFLKICNKATI